MKVEAYYALGRLQEARDELMEARKGWGSGNETIEDAFKKTDFELRVQRAEGDLHRIMTSVESGVQPELREGDPIHMNLDDRRSAAPIGTRSPRRNKSKSDASSSGRTGEKRRSGSRSARDKRHERRNSNGSGIRERRPSAGRY